MGYILCCVDKGEFSEQIAKYAIMASQNMDLDIKFLNVVEHEHIDKKDLNLAGNIKLGEIDDMLEQSVKEEAKLSKEAIKEGKEVLTKILNNAKQSCSKNISSLQIHGDFVENILELKNDIEFLIIGIHSDKSHQIGNNVKDIIKSINKPVLLVNSDFVQPKKMLIAYNGSKESKKIIESISKKPVFKKDILRDIVNLNIDIQKGETLVEEAKTIYKKRDIDVETTVLNGDKASDIINYFEKKDYDILAMGAYGHSWIKELVFGSFTTQILENIKKPILLYR